MDDGRVPCISPLVDEVENGNILVSPVLRIVTGEEIKPLLVADSAYELTKWCIMPDAESAATTHSQRDFNEALSSARVVIDQAFGKLKGGWCCLLNKLDESLDKIPQTIVACCILHNVCLNFGDGADVDPHNDGPNYLSPFPGQDADCEGARLGKLIRETFF